MRGCARTSLRLLSLCAALALFAGCASGGSTEVTAPRATPTATLPYITPTTAPVTGFPAFTDWRVVYIGQDGYMHAVSLDGKTDVAGPHTPPSTNGSGIWAAGVAPDGRRLAFSNTAEVFYLDTATSPNAQFQLVRLAAEVGWAGLFWSPYGAHLAVGGPGGVSIITLATGAITAIPIASQTPVPSGGPVSDVDMVYGWLDSAHLAVEYVPGEFPYGSQWGPVQIEANLASLDIATGALRPIATVRPSPVSQMQGGRYSLTPDGAEALFTGAQYRAAPYAPLADRVDIATGRVTPLPAISAILPTVGGVFRPLWIPHTHLALGWFVSATTSGLSYDIIDVDRDTVTPVSLSGFPVAWSPDGRTLVVASAIPTDEPDFGDSKGGSLPANYGPVTLTAINFNASWVATHSVTLTTKAMLIPTLGLIHTA